MFAPEADPLNFTPRLRIPLLMLNGGYDFVHHVEGGLNPFIRFLGTPPEHQVRRVYETDHQAPRLERIKETMAFLNKYLGRKVKADLTERVGDSARVRGELDFGHKIRAEISLPEKGRAKFSSGRRSGHGNEVPSMSG